jgi:hypothetical protein
MMEMMSIMHHSMVRMMMGAGPGMSMMGPPRGMGMTVGHNNNNPWS